MVLGGQLPGRVDGRRSPMGSELSWLERTPDKREVSSSSPLRPTIKKQNGICTLKTTQKK